MIVHIAGKHSRAPARDMTLTRLYSIAQQHIYSPSLVWPAAFVVVVVKVVAVELFSWTGETWTVDSEALTMPAEKMGEDATSAVRAV